MNSIFKRISVRNYQDKEIEDEKIEMLLKAAMAAPSAGNQQPWEFFVAKNKEVLSELSKCSQYSGCLKDASIAIIPCYRTSDLVFKECTYMDMGASVENILLEAVEQGIGAVWLGIAPSEERMKAVKNILNIGSDLEPFAIISCGYPLVEKEQKDRYDESRVHYIN